MPWLALESRCYCFQGHHPLQKSLNTHSFFVVWSGCIFKAMPTSRVCTLVIRKPERLSIWYRIEKTCGSPFLCLSHLVLTKIQPFWSPNVWGFPPYQGLLHNASYESYSLTQFWHCPLGFVSHPTRLLPPNCRCQLQVVSPPGYPQLHPTWTEISGLRDPFLGFN